MLVLQLLAFCAVCWCQDIKDGKPNIDVYSGVYYDRFHLETGLAVTGGYLDVDCTFPPGERCTTGKEILTVVYPNGRERNEVCVNDTNYATFRFNITSNLPFGNYMCKYKGVLGTKKFFMGYRICDNREDFCANSKLCKGQEVCVISTKGNTSCGKIPSVDLCYHHEPGDILEYNICPVMERSLCGMLTKGYLSGAFAYSLIVFCKGLTESQFPRIQYADKYYAYEYPINIKPEQKIIKIVYTKNPSLQKIRITCITWGVGGVQVDKHSQLPTAEETRVIPVSKKIFSGGSRIYKLQCYFQNLEADRPPEEKRNAVWDSRIADMRATLVFIANDTTVEIVGPKNAHGQMINHLECRLKPIPPDDFKVDYLWIQKNKSAKNYSGSTLAISEDGEYQCLVTVIYKSCSPPALFKSGIFKSKPVQAFYMTTTTSKGTTITTKSNEIYYLIVWGTVRFKILQKIF